MSEVGIAQRWRDSASRIHSGATRTRSQTSRSRAQRGRLRTLSSGSTVSTGAGGPPNLTPTTPTSVPSFRPPVPRDRRPPGCTPTADPPRAPGDSRDKCARARSRCIRGGCHRRGGARRPAASRLEGLVLLAGPLVEALGQRDPRDPVLEGEDLPRSSGARASAR